jgi:hypothetical protein
VPTVPLASVVVVKLGAGETTTFVDVDSVVLAIEVAVTVTVILEETDFGALYVAVVVVWLEKVPQAVPLHVVPDMLQFTPAPLVSFVTWAVKLKVCP